MKIDLKKNNIDLQQTGSNSRQPAGASNEEIREHLGVSRRTVVRYLDALEKEGKVEQVGEAGRGVIYRLQ